MSLLQEMFPLLIPIFVLDVILAVAAVRHILWHPHYRFGNRAMWLVLSLVVVCSVLLSILFLGGVRKNECTFYMQSV